jgi:hypothetical protein
MSLSLSGKAPTDDAEWTPNMDAVRAIIRFAREIARRRMDYEIVYPVSLHDVLVKTEHVVLQSDRHANYPSSWLSPLDAGGSNSAAKRERAKRGVRLIMSARMLRYLSRSRPLLCLKLISLSMAWEVLIAPLHTSLYMGGGSRVSRWFRKRICAARAALLSLYYGSRSFASLIASLG